MELGKGFLFEARQKRFTLDEKHFRVDLVTHNRLLKCCVLIDLNTDLLVHIKVQDFQTETAKNIVRVFTGQPKGELDKYRRDIGSEKRCDN